MKRNGYSLVILLTMAISVMYIFDPNKNHTNPREKELARKERKEFSDAARIHQEFLMLRDPRTNRIPGNIRNLELRFAEQLPKHYGTILLKGSQVQNAQALTWVERGPNNVAGRVRALGLDIRQTGTATILAGGASGGMWKSTDGGSTWVKKTTASQLHSVTCVAQDTRSGSQDVWYYGTGEYIGNSAGQPNDPNPFFGSGVFKSTDNGETWTQLTNTAVSSTTLTSDWQYVYNIAVHPTSGNVYAATIGGIYKSINGGTDWTKVLNTGNQSSKTDVTIAADGTIYSATSSDGGAAAGIYKSVSEGSFTSANPVAPATLFPGTFGRTIIKTAPSNSGVVYFFTEAVSGTNNTPNVHNHQLWRSTDAGGTWSNISSVIPANTQTTAGLSNLDTQGGYDMLLSVKPDNPDFIIVGGVSIFKIADVTAANNADAATDLKAKHIGGYGIQDNGTRNDLGDFINHHPDNHVGVFKPGSNTIFYCGNDGGIALANDITATPYATPPATSTFWQTPLRTGLNVSQLYAVSIAPESGSGYIAGGFQDRGNWMAKTNNANETPTIPVSWSEQGGGDGTFCAIAPDAQNTVYQATTNGAIFRYAKSETATPVTTTTDMKPTGVSNVLFVNPFTLDPTGNVLYFAGGSTNTANSGIWRNTSPTTATTSVGWTFLANSEVTSTQVTAISVSTANSTNVLYYGTSDGKVYRINGANTGDPAKTEVSSGAGFPAGYVSSIAVDPANSANVIVTFSNYSVDRIWYSTDSGASWTNVTGNLNGAISVRWAKMFTVGSTPHYFLATSTGVYYTTSLSGTPTWTQEAATSIGNVVCVMLDYRSADNTLIVATHGRGVFETTIATALPVELTTFAAAYTGDGVALSWQTATEVNNYGFKVERGSTSHTTSSQGITWETLGFVQGHGNSNSTKSYSFIDKNAPSGKVQYRLKQIDFDGKYEYSNVVEVNVNAFNRLELSQNFPNPFNPVTTISYSLPNVSKVKLVIYDVTGREVAILVNEFQSVGKHSVNFNASRIASGVYYYRIQAGDIIQTKKMVLMK